MIGLGISIDSYESGLPTDLGFLGAALIARYRADYVVRDGSGNVQTLTDLSGSGLDATQGTSGQRPAYTASWTNSKPAVTWDGTKGSLVAAGVTTTQPYTMICAVQATNIASDRLIMDGTGSSNRSVVDLNGSNAIAVFCGTGSTTATSNLVTVPHIVSVVFNNASTKVYVDGAALTMGGAASGTQSLAGLTIGAQFDGAGAWFWGSIGELMILNGDFSTGGNATLRSQVESLLKTYWGTP